MANLFDIAVARKLSGGGGGGSSDFSTATVTLNMTPPEGMTIANVTAGTYMNFGVSPSSAFGYRNDFLNVTDNKAEILLYQGVGYLTYVTGYDENWEYLAFSDNGNATLAGNIIWDSSIGNNGAFVVTGDCTITADFIAD